MRISVLLSRRSVSTCASIFELNSLLDSHENFDLVACEIFMHFQRRLRPLNETAMIMLEGNKMELEMAA